ncbi:MAG: lipocalin-like domain-containing protein [Pseudomonadales bacterium]
MRETDLQRSARLAPTRKRTLISAMISVLLLSAGACDAPEPAGVAGAGQLRLGAVLGSDNTSGFQRAEGVVPLVFPEDLGAHPAFRSEWWYLTLLLEADAASAATSEFGVQFTLFRQALTPARPVSDNAWLTPQVFLAHFALTDVGQQSHRAYERAARGHPQLAGVQARPFRAWLEDWVLEADARNPDVWRLRLLSGAGGAAPDAVNLTLDAGAPPILQGDAGLSWKGPDQASYYYSVPRMPVKGTLTSAGENYAVTGSGWLDREWSTSVLGAGQVGWDWFALTLDDGRSLMVFQLRRDDGGRDDFDQGLLIDAAGGSRHLSARDFTLTPLRYWRDGRGVNWPVEWTLSVDGSQYRLAAAVDDQRMNTTITYWEGLIDVLSPSGERSGRGYMELTGYERE